MAIAYLRYHIITHNTVLFGNQMRVLYPLTLHMKEKSLAVHGLRECECVTATLYTILYICHASLPANSKSYARDEAGGEERNGKETRLPT